MSDWKNDPVEFLKMKVRYGNLLGLLHGALYLVQEMCPHVDLDTMKKMQEVYMKMHNKSLDELEEIVADTFNCGWIDQEPTIDWIVGDNFLHERFPVDEQTSDGNGEQGHVAEDKRSGDNGQENSSKEE